MAVHNLTKNKYCLKRILAVCCETNLSNDHFLHVQSILVLNTLVLNLKVTAVIINLEILILRTLRMFFLDPTCISDLMISVVTSSSTMPSWSALVTMMGWYPELSPI